MRREQLSKWGGISYPIGREVLFNGEGGLIRLGGRTADFFDFIKHFDRHVPWVLWCCQLLVGCRHFHQAAQLSGSVRRFFDFSTYFFETHCSVLANKGKRWRVGNAFF